MISTERNEKPRIWAFLLVCVAVDLSSSASSTSSADILNIRHGRSRVRHSTEKNHIRWGLQAFDNLTLIDYDYENVNGSSGSNETLFDVVANRSPMLVGDSYYMYESSGSTDTFRPPSTASPQSISRLSTSSSPRKKLPKRQSMELIRKDVEEGLEYLRTHSHLLQPTASMPSQKVLSERVSAPGAADPKATARALQIATDSVSSLSAEMHKRDKNNDKLPSFSPAADATTGGERRQRPRDRLSQRDPKRRPSGDNDYSDYTAQNDGPPALSSHNGGAEHRQKNEMGRLATESTMITLTTRPLLSGRGIEGERHLNDNGMDVNQWRPNETKTTRKLQTQTGEPPASARTVSTAAPETVGAQRRNLEPSPRFNKNSNNQFEYENHLAEQQRQPARLSELGKLPLSKSAHHRSYQRPAAATAALTAQLRSPESAAIDAESNRFDDERNQFPIEIGKHFPPDKYQFNHIDNSDGTERAETERSTTSAGADSSHAHTDAILNLRDANNESNNNNSDNDTSDNNGKSHSAGNGSDAHGSGHFEPSSLLSSHDEDNDADNGADDGSDVGSFAFDGDDERNVDRQPALYAMDLNSAELDEMSETSRKNRLQMMQGKDVVTEFLQIVERSMDNNCSAGTAVNLGEGVVDQYAQERFHVKADVAVNRANMLTR